MEKLKYTVITGASSGIGYETAKAFADRDKPLILVARRKKRLQQLKQAIRQKNPNLEVLIFPVDLTIKENVYQLFSDLTIYELETWINNAGIGMYGGLRTNDLQKTEHLLQLNIEAFAILSSLFVKDYFSKAGTQLINISSAGRYTIVPNAVLYCATKFFVSAFTGRDSRRIDCCWCQHASQVISSCCHQNRVRPDSSEHGYL
ncbi:hypothetical protein NRIC_00070 [Enterococcus florum]|uniref:Oxidoreductase n=1 Tax=Enterococcus florum TaxID=2480627 RepID=A0A4P5P3T2_9ENTE|nr:SDR family NAD(P)-dependent oxidoreductase [Enterococcus florum]GCF92116.1 hypothetical protein NRIC_00070 [Enterococcus florum]